jgi:hypothetical protein
MPEMAEPMPRHGNEALGKAIKDEDAVAEAGAGNNDEATARDSMLMADHPAALVRHGSRQHRRRWQKNSSDGCCRDPKTHRAAPAKKVGRCIRALAGMQGTIGFGPQKSREIPVGEFSRRSRAKKWDGGGARYATRTAAPLRAWKEGQVPQIVSARLVADRE